MGLLSNRVGLLSNGVGLFSRERVLENTPTPLFEQPLELIAHGYIFERLRYFLSAHIIQPCLQSENGCMLTIDSFFALF